MRLFGGIGRSLHPRVDSSGANDQRKSPVDDAFRRCPGCVTLVGQMGLCVAEFVHASANPRNFRHEDQYAGNRSAALTGAAKQRAECEDESGANEDVQHRCTSSIRLCTSPTPDRNAVHHAVHLSATSWTAGYALETDHSGNEAI